MWNKFLARRLQLFDSVIKKEINQYCIYFGLGMIPQDLATDQFNTPNAATCHDFISHGQGADNVNGAIHLLVGPPMMIH